MANKAFAIQSSALKIGGVELEAGTTTIVIPGVTQAANYRVEEVDETGEQTNALNLPIVIDNVTHTAKVADAGASVVAYATYSAQLDGDDYIEELDVNTAGTYVGSEVDRNADFDMWGYTGSDAEGYLTNWVTGDWVQIPFRPKMRAGEVENVGGNGAGVVDRSVVFPGGATGDTAGILASDSGTLYYSTGDYTDVNDIDKQFEVDNTDDFDVSQTGGTSNSIRILAADYSGLKDILDTLNNAEEDYQTDFTVDGGGDFGGAQVVTQVSYNGTTIDFLWPHRTGVDPTSILQGETFTVEYIGTIPQPAIWTRILASDITTDVSKYTTELTVANKDFDIRTTRSNPGQDADIGIYAADDLWLEAAGDEVSITAANEVTINTNNANSSHEWIFNASGHVQFPDGSVQVTAYTGTGDDNIWIETFASDAPTTDFVQGATSVEYDADGNVVALFSHYVPGDPEISYTSVAKLTPTGAVLWQVRFGANLYSDGWGLAYDTVNNYVYVAGRTSGTPLTYEFATLTRLSGADGSIGWSKTYDFEANSTSVVVDVDSDGNPVMVGYAYNGTDTYIVTTKIDQADGTVVWSKTLDGQGNDEAYGMAIGPNNEIVTIGYASQLGATDAAATLYTDPVSNPNWTQTAGIIGGSGATYTVSFTDGVPTFTNINDPVGGRTVDSILDTLSGVSFGGTTPADDMIVKVGTLAANDTDDRMVVVKYATDGTIAWQKAVQFDAGYDCKGADADIDSAGNIYVCGSYQYDYQTYTTSAMSLVKFNSSGVKQWSRRVVGNCDTFGTSVVVGDDDQVYLSGITGTDNTDDYTWVVAKYNTDGVVTWQRLIDNTTTWTFGGSFWFGGSGGSNIAVKSGYIALAGSFGDISTQPIAVVLQIDTDATPFSVGDWDIKGASFSGVLDASASDIVVVNANKPVATVVPAVNTFAINEDLSNFLTVTRYGLAGGNDSLVNGAYTVTLGNTGTVTLPAGGTITEGYITSNPTIQLTPASPTVASQKLVIKGGGLYDFTQNGININYNDNTATVGTTLTFYVYSTTYTGQTLYWWINPQGAGIGNSESGTVTLTPTYGEFSILVNSDDYEFTVRVSPEADNYDPANLGVESGLINADAPTFDADHHLHLTTGNLTETSIFLGTDNHNVRTTVNGGIKITTTTYGAVDSLNSSTSQGGYNIGTYTGLTTTGGSGTGLTVNATSTGGYIDFVTIVNPGTGYTDGDVLTLVGGDGLGCTLNIVVLGTSEWKFNAIGTTTFPTLTVPIEDNVTPTGTGQVLKFSDSTQQAIIFGPVSTAGNNSAERVIIQGAPGYTGTAGEGGDVYVWAGSGGSANGQGGDIKVRAGKGIGTGTGGYLNFQAGDSQSGQGGYINIESGEGASNQGGDIDVNARNGGDINLYTVQDGTITLSTPNGSLTMVSAATAQVGSSLVIATGNAYGNTAVSIASNTALVNTYLPGGTITFQDGDVRTITQIDDYPGGTDIFWDTAKTGILFPVTLKTADFVAATPARSSITVVGKQWTFAADGKLTLPGAVVNSTVTVTTPLAQGIMTSFVSSPNTDAGWVDGNYDVTWQGGGSATISILGQTFNTISNQVLGTALWSVSDIIGSFAVGGSVPLVLTVDTIDDVAPLDLTKSVNKLISGNYTLADGVEGQIMHLVRKTGSVYNTIIVNVANGRVDGGLNTTINYYPFDSGALPALNISTLIFTDGAWQASNGTWD